MQTSCLGLHGGDYAAFASGPGGLYMYTGWSDCQCPVIPSVHVPTDIHHASISKDMVPTLSLGLSLLGWVPFALGLPNLHLARATTAAPVVSHETSMVHSAYMGTPTVTGALNASSTLAANLSSLSVAPSATTYPSDGKLHDPAPAPFVPAGGVGTNGTTPVYNVKSDFDFESLVSLLSFLLFLFALVVYGS